MRHPYTESVLAFIACVAFGVAGCTREKPPLTAPAPAFGAPQTFTVATPTSMQIPTASAPGSGAPMTYTVQWGDWLSKIAAQFGVTTQAIVAANPGLNPNRIYPGQVLNIPTSPGTTVPLATPGGTGGVTPRASPSASAGPDSNRTPPDVDARPTLPPSSAGPTTYTVQRGDWLYAIARKFGVSVPALQAANPGINLSVVYPGQVLNIPSSGTMTTPAPTTPGNPSSYVVQPGDTLFSIAVRFHTTTYAFQIANHLANQNFIFPGQVLEIPKVPE